MLASDASLPCPCLALKPGEEEFVLDHDKGWMACLKVTCFQISNFFSMLGILVQVGAQHAQWSMCGWPPHQKTYPLPVHYI